MSGVLRSLNYYPIGDEEAEEGIASLALGLGKYIVDGGQTLRVCPYHPHQVLQTSETEMALRDTQTQFYALDMKHVGEDFKVDDGFNILKLRVKDAVEDQSLNYIASTFDPYDQVINDGVYETGRKTDHLCRCAPARCGTLAGTHADVDEVWFRGDAPSCGNRVCLQYQCRQDLRFLSAPDSSDRGCQGDARRGCEGDTGCRLPAAFPQFARAMASARMWWMWSM